MGRETDLPSTGRKRMEEEGKERKEKEKPGVILVRKKKRQKVKSVFFWGVGGIAQRDGVNAHRHSKPKGLLLGLLLVGQGFTEDSRGVKFATLRHTLLAQASSSHVVSCSTRIISLISALIFSKVNRRFLSASSVPPPLLLFVVTKIFMAANDM